MRQPCFPFLIPGWRCYFIMTVFREENVLFFEQNKRFETAARKTNRRGTTLRRQKKTAQGLNPARSCIFKKWFVRHFFRLNEEKMG